MVMRNQLGSVFVSESVDGGRTWSEAKPSVLNAPESCPCIAKVPNSDALLVVWNNRKPDNSSATHGGRRNPLTMAISRDGLKTFTDFYDLETDFDYAFTNPSIMITSDNLFVLNYWTTKYNEKGFMGGDIHLKIATFRVDI
jgi:sialidase-1